MKVNSTLIYNLLRRGNPITIRRDVPIISQSATLLAEINHRCAPKVKLDLGPEQLAEGLQRLLLRIDFRTHFSWEDEVTLSPHELSGLLVGHEYISYSDAPVYERREVTTLEQAQPWITRFLYLYQGRPVDQTTSLHTGKDFNLRNEPKAFFARGPQENIQVGVLSDPHCGAAQFTKINIPAGSYYFVEPVLDNLVILQFMVYDKDLNWIRSYAYDASVPCLFSVYSYPEEEKRQFGIFNARLLNETEREHANTCMRKLLTLLQKLFAEGHFDNIPDLDFYLAGPARTINIDTGNGPRLSFPSLNLQPEAKYAVRIFGAHPGKQNNTIAISFRETGQGKHTPTTYLYSRRERCFVQVQTATVDEKNRIKLPQNVRYQVWDRGPCLITLS